MTTRFVLNELGIQEVGHSAGLLIALEAIALDIAENVKAIAPVDDDADVHYIDLITVDTGELAGHLVARVNANKFTANWLEFGTGEPGPTPAFAPMRRGAERAGFLLVGGRF